MKEWVFIVRRAILALWFPIWLVILVYLNMQQFESHDIALRLFTPLSVLMIILMADIIQSLLKKAQFWLILVSIVVTVFATEFIYETFLAPQADTLSNLQVYTHPERWLFRPHHYANFVVNPDWATDEGDIVNERGFRGEEIMLPKPDGVYRIVAIGGSTTYGTSVLRWQEAYPEQLEQILSENYGYSQIEVINAGQPDYSSWESLINLEFRVLDVEPDMIIIYLNTNDVHARIVPPEIYRSDNVGRRRLWNFEEYALTNTRLEYIPSRLLQQLALLTGIADLPNRDLDTYVSQPCTGNNASPDCLGMSFESVLEANPPIYYDRNIRSMVGIAQANNIDVVLMTWAHSPLFDDYASSNHYQQGYREHNEVMKIISLDMDTYFYDFVADMPTDMEYWWDGRHLNNIGNQLKAELIAAHLVSENALPQP